MEYLKETNKNLMGLRASLITVMIVLTGGIVGLILADIDFIKLIPLVILGLYFDFLFLCNIIEINRKINDNLGELKK